MIRERETQVPHANNYDMLVLESVSHLSFEESDQTVHIKQSKIQDSCVLTENIKVVPEYYHTINTAIRHRHLIHT